MVATPTMKGDVESTGLGVTLMHEHVFVCAPEINLNYPETWGDNEQRIAKAIDDLNEAYEHGVRTIVDCTVLGLGRDVERLKRVASEVEVNIICATGYYTWNDLPNFFNISGPTKYGALEESEDVLPSMLLRDIEVGIADTGVKAGVLKCMAHHGMTLAMERIARAVAQVHRSTGVPITTHTHSVPDGLTLLDVLLDEGVDPHRVVIGHVDASSKNQSYLLSLLETGCFIGFDSFGLEGDGAGEAHATTFQERIDAIVKLCSLGYDSQIVLSHDYASFCDQVPADWFSGRLPNWSYHRVSDDAVPALLKAGVDQTQIDRMLVTNPMRFFESRGLGGY